MTAATTTHREHQNALFEALSNHRRRYTLYACNDAGGELTLGDIAEQVAAWEYDKGIEEITSSERKRVYTSLQQHHLKRLEDAGLVEVNGDRVTLTDRARNVDLYLEVVPGETIPWSLYYIGLAVIGGFALAIAMVFELPEAVTIEVIAAGVVLVFLVSAVVHLLETRGRELGVLEVPPPVNGDDEE